MAQEQPPVPETQRNNVIPLLGAQLRKRVNDAIAAALDMWPPIVTADARKQMIDLDVNTSQIFHGMRRAEISDFAEDSKYGRMSFTGKLLSAGEEFFVSASVERVVPFHGTHVVINRVWR